MKHCSAIALVDVSVRSYYEAAGKESGSLVPEQEKLEYNLQVLSERNKEHTAIQSSYKNRLNRLRETLNTLMSRYNTLDQKYKTHNHELTEEYKRVTKQFKDLQASWLS